MLILRLTLVAVLTLLFFQNCQNTNPNSNPNAQQAPGSTAGPDSNDLLDALQGKWQSTADSTYFIEFVNDTVRHYSGTSLTEVSVIAVDVNCREQACGVVDSTDVDGWCYMEKSASGTQCNMVMQCDSAQLKLTAIGASNPEMVFRKSN